MLACHHGLAAVAQQQHPDARVEWLDDFAVDSKEQYTVTGDVRWAAGKVTLSPGATISVSPLNPSYSRKQRDRASEPAPVLARSAFGHPHQFHPLGEAASSTGIRARLPWARPR